MKSRHISAQDRLVLVAAPHICLVSQVQQISQKNEHLSELLTEKDLLLVQKDTLLEEKVQLLTEKGWLLKEIHHRVKNNFHIVASLLEIQSGYLKNKEGLSAIKESRNRIHSMSIIHQKLYQSETLSTIHMPEYIYELVDISVKATRSGKTSDFRCR